MRKWAIGLHFYQPPVQDLAVTNQVLKSCYLPLLKLIKSRPQARLTLNVSGCLLEQLVKLEQKEFFNLLREVVESNQVELLNSPTNHPVMPLVPISLIERQIERQKLVTKETVGVKLGQGLFPPELAINEEILNWTRAKFEYVLVDETAVNSKFDKEVVWTDPIERYKGTKLVVNCRSASEILRSYPDRLTSQYLANWVKSRTQDSQTIVTVNDAEVFGHHYEERLEALTDLFESREFEFLTISEAAAGQAGRIAEKVDKSSWQVWEGEERTRSFKLWADEDNDLQQKYLGLMRLAEEAVVKWSKVTEPTAVNYAKEFLDKGCSSCYLYWLSNWPWWHPDLVARGAEQLIKCVRTLQAPNSEKRKAEKVYHTFLTDMWLYHWSGKVEEKYKKYNNL